MKVTYNGTDFESIAHARWALLFDLCDIRWVYRPMDAYVNGSKICRTTFLIQGLDGRCNFTYVIVDDDSNETLNKEPDPFGVALHVIPKYTDEFYENNNFPMYTVPKDVPSEWGLSEIDDRIKDDWSEHDYYSFSGIDGDTFCGYIGVNENGRGEIFGDDSNYLVDRDEAKTLSAYRRAACSVLKYADESQYWERLEEYD